MNDVSDVYNELLAFLARCGTVRDGVEHNYVDIAPPARKYALTGDQVVQYFDLLNACRKDGCRLHHLERVTEAPCGLMFDLDRKQPAPTPCIFSTSIYHSLANSVANAVCAAVHPSELGAQPSAPNADDLCDILDFATGDTPAALPAPAATAAPAAPAATGAFSFHIFIIKRPAITQCMQNAADQTAAPEYKDGIHILVPDLWFAKNVRFFIQTLVTKELPQVFGADAPVPLGTREAMSLMDIGSSRVQNMLYGSCKVSNGIAYDLACAVRVDVWGGRPRLTPLSVEAISKDGLSGRTIKDGGIPVNITYELSISTYMPTFRGARTWLVKRIPKCSPAALRDAETIGTKFAAIDNRPEMIEARFRTDLENAITNSHEVSYAHKLAMALPVEFAKERTRWRDTLAVLAHCANKHGDCAAGFALVARAFSMRGAEKWDPAGHEKTWADLVARSARLAQSGGAALTIRSLEYWVRQHNQNEYLRIQNNCVFKFMEDRASSGRIDNDTVARAMYMSLGGQFATDTDRADISSRKHWFEFVGDHTLDAGEGDAYKWRATSEPHALYRFISERLYPMCVQIASNIKQRAASLPEDDEKGKRLRALASAYKSSCTAMLRSHQFQASSVTAATHLFNIRDFARDLDADPFVIGVQSGVLRFHPEVELIQGYHNYRVSRRTRADYVPFDPVGNKYIAEVLTEYRKIFVEEDAFNFFWYYVSTWIDGCDVQRILFSLGGVGMNGKSASVALVQAALGDKYVKTLKMALLTGDREKANDANSALMQLKGARGGILDESAEGDTLNAARTKSLVSAGLQSGRDLFSREEQFRSTANLIAISNFPILMDSNDTAIWDRFRYYRCKCRFVQNPNPENQFEHKIRREITYEWINNQNYLNAVLAILVHYHGRLFSEYGGDLTRVPCATIERETAQFRQKQDLVARFVHERCVRTASKDSIVPLADFISEFAEWSRDICGKRKIISPVQAQEGVLRQFVRTRTHIGENGETIEGEPEFRGIRIRKRGATVIADDETPF